MYPIQSALDPTAAQQKDIGSHPESSAVSLDNNCLLQALRSGNEAAFVSLLDLYSPSMLRLAIFYNLEHAVAEEVVQETWMRVVQNLERFEERSSLKTWIFGILINTVRKRGQYEGRSVPFSSLPISDAEGNETVMDAEQFFPTTHPQWPGHWTSFPKNWEHIPEDRLLAQETRLYVRKAIEALPQKQREVIVLCDIEGWTSDEVCHFLNLTKIHQRVLLYRARSQVRNVLDRYFNEE